MNDGPKHVRRPRYAGKNPRKFQDKYKELNPERYAAEVQSARNETRSGAEPRTAEIFVGHACAAGTNASTAIAAGRSLRTARSFGVR